MERDKDFSAYMSARWSALARSAVLLGCTTHEAEDLVQTTLIRCYTSWDKIAKAHERDAYVYRVLVNAHTKSRRRRWWSERSTDQLPEHVTSDPTGQVDDHDALREAVAALSPPNRAAVVLRYYAQLSEAETAHVLGIAPGTVKSRVARAIAQLSADPNLTDVRTETSHE